MVVFVHGTAAFRHQSLHQTVHWASRGFVVVAADHHGLKLGDILAPFTNNRDDRPERSRDLEADLDAIFAALTEPSGELAFLSGRVDTERMAVAGHSAGGNAAAEAAGREGVQLVIPMASLRRRPSKKCCTVAMVASASPRSSTGSPMSRSCARNAERDPQRRLPAPTECNDGQFSRVTTWSSPVRSPETSTR